MAEYQYPLEEITIDARAYNWDIFKPDWEFLQAFPALSLCSLVGLSVGLHPWFSRPDWVFHCAKPYFEGNRDSELDPPATEDDQAKAEDLQRFLKRIHIAAGNLAPAGTLNPIDGIAQGAATVVSVAEFLAFAGRLDWELPEKFTRFYALTDVEEPGEAEEDNDQNNKGVREQQIQKIIAKANEFGYDLLSIPLGGKAKIKGACYPVITESAFDRAWIEAGKRGLISIKDKIKFYTKQ
ncbi:MAG: hypothetical protein BVN35_21150 [Proteobacteria bacterium ST_bin11]|nr:MAG: hypothetical protein BVN35_21150 [Proteobacteria bacterium ST_bin11]